ncbi:MAG: hypothetical protein K0B81_08745 [Candidatus Cloacimonetes bacterium]|nr:hypothetical protein [Candidatus Cloacimonadota bacterium]
MSSSNEILLEWESFPLRENPQKSLFAVFILIAIFAILWYITIVLWQMPLFYILGIILVIVELLPYFIPTRYIMMENRFEVYYLSIKIEKRYEDFRCFYADDKGIMLGTFLRPRWLDKYRGQSLRFSKDKSEKEELLKLLERKIGNRR